MNKTDGLANRNTSIRICHLKKQLEYKEYGFYFYQEECKQVIAIVDEGSPAEIAGLQVGDKIIEVNGVDVTNESHAQVVTRIKAIPLETKLLVKSSEIEEVDSNSRKQSKSSFAKISHSSSGEDDSLLQDNYCF